MVLARVRQQRPRSPVAGGQVQVPGHRNGSGITAGLVPLPTMVPVRWPRSVHMSSMLVGQASADPQPEQAEHAGQGGSISCWRPAWATKAAEFHAIQAQDADSSEPVGRRTYSTGECPVPIDHRHPVEPGYGRQPAADGGRGQTRDTSSISRPDNSTCGPRAPNAVRLCR